ncbi:acyltransferase [Halorubrum sp. AD140]|uniref:acyltransferase n=1 Tax=Halorubrum sp. AD140 TaxID=3050073 RepID=UPI002ACD07EE|nr:acyltransferase [Halorubrum sp. AD140]MDZ5812977.1 acyltransferase [Halorubrum sp. AD140]
MTKRHIDLPTDVEEAIDRTIGDVDRRLSGDEETAVVVLEVLADLFGDWHAYERYREGDSLPPLTRARIESYDPRNVRIESEHWAEQDLADLREAKCLRHLWRGFDLSPLANNLAFALPFREMLADHLFEEAGTGLQLFGGIKIQCGHNIEIGDNVVVHNDVLLDDRGELVIGDRVSVADRSHLHTHSHDTVDQTDVTTYRTVVEDDVRLGYDAMIDAGCRVGENSLVGASSMVRGDVPAHQIAVGSPAKTVKTKPGWEPVAEHPGPLADNREERRLDRELPADLDPFDEFGRDLSPPGEPTDL